MTRTTTLPAPRGAALGVQLLEGTRAGSVPLYAQLYTQLREHILAGALPPGSRLPSARMLATDLGISRNTVEAAYLRLQSEGFTLRRVGAGTVVAASVAEVAPFRGRVRQRPAPRQHTERPVAPPPRRELSDRGRVLVRLGRAELEADRFSGPCATDVESFPSITWQRLLARQIRRHGAALLRSGEPQGSLVLRRAIARHVRLTRGVQCEAEQVVVVNSTQQALDLASRILLDPGDRALVEEPGYPSARGALLAGGARLGTVPVDGEGLVTAELPADPGPSLLYVTPSHQYPLGVTMSLPRRLAALRWAAATGAWILEDDYDSEFRYDGRPIAALQGLDRAGRVLYLGTWNKVLFPGLRLAYLVVPPELVAPFVAARRLTDGVSSPLMQAVLAEFLSAGYLTAYLRAARQHYVIRRDALVHAIARAWGDRVRLGPFNTGLHLVAHLPPGSDDVGLTHLLPDGGGMTLGALSRQYAGTARSPGLLLGYGAAPETTIERVVATLAPAIHKLRPC